MILNLRPCGEIFFEWSLVQPHPFFGGKVDVDDSPIIKKHTQSHLSKTTFQQHLIKYKNIQTTSKTF